MEKNDVINQLLNDWHNSFPNQSNVVPRYEVRQWLESRMVPMIEPGDVWNVRYCGETYEGYVLEDDDDVVLSNGDILKVKCLKFLELKYRNHRNGE